VVRTSATHSEQHFRAAQQRLLQAEGVGFTSRYLNCGHPSMERVHLLEVGSGPPTLLIHGGNSIAAGWSPLLARLQNDFHLYAPDRPGCGLTGPVNYHHVADFRAHAIDFITSVLDATGQERMDLIGNSMGGFWALLFALEHPERVRRLVLLGEPAGASDSLLWRYRLAATPVLNRLLYATKLRPIRKKTRQLLAAVVAHPERLSEAFLDVVHAGATLPWAQRAWLSMLECVAAPGRRVELTYSLRPLLGRLQTPVLLVWGDRDPVSCDWGRRLVEVLPNARLECLSDAGHLPWLDEPDRVADLVRGFLLGQPSAASPLDWVTEPASGGSLTR
jgi:pimeloyl-ACP methyl ester carboxylesterase